MTPRPSLRRPAGRTHRGAARPLSAAGLASGRGAPLPLPAVLTTWPAWAAPAALAGMWASGLLAAVLVVVALPGVDPAAAKLASALLAGAGAVAVLVWLGRGTGECSAARFGLSPVAPRRAATGSALVACAVAVAWALSALAGLGEELRVPRELTRLDGLDWLAGGSEPPVRLDAAAVAALLARAVIATVVLELVLRGVALPALARLAGAWPAIAVTGLIGGASWGAIAGDGRLLVPAMVLGVLLGPLFVGTGSIVPGTGVAAGFAGAAFALSCGWGAAAAALTAAAAGALVTGVLLAIAGRGPAASEAAVALPRAKRLAGEAGQTAAEYMGLLLIVALIIGALFASGIAVTITRNIEILICRIAGGDCTALETAVDKDCMVSRTISTGGMAVTIAVVKIGEESTMIKQEFADGRTVFTLIKNASVAGELIAGAKARAGNIGFDATASVSAGGRLEGARTYTFTDPEEAAAFEAQVRQHGSFGQVVRDSVEGIDPFGIKDWALDHVVGEDVDAGDLPEPDSTYVNIDALITGEAAAIGNVILADAGASALLEYAGGARIYTGGEKDGTVELNMALDGEVAGQLGLLMLGPEIEGKANFTVRVTLDPDNGYRPSHMRVIATAGYNGNLSDADFRLNPTTGQLEQIQDALKRGKLESGSLVSTDGEGQQVEFTADMDLTTDAERAEALALFTGTVPAAAAASDLARRMEERGRLTFQAYNTTASSTEAGLKVGLGVGVGAEGSQTNESRDLGGSWVREPGGSWQVRNCGPR